MHDFTIVLPGAINLKALRGIMQFLELENIFILT